MRARLLTETGAFRAWWSLVVVVASALMVAGACIVYTGHAQRQADRRWCELLITLDQPAQPPTTDRGREIQRQLHELRGEMGCGERG